MWCFGTEWTRGPATQPFFLKNSWSKEGQERIRCVKAQGKKKGSGQCTLTLTQQEKGTASFVETIHSKKRTPVFPKGNNSPSTVTSTEFLQITRFHYHIVDQSMFFIVRVAIAGGYGCHWLCRRLVVPSNQLLVLSRGIGLRSKRLRRTTPPSPPDSVLGSERENGIFTENELTGVVAPSYMRPRNFFLYYTMYI